MRAVTVQLRFARIFAGAVARVRGTAAHVSDRHGGLRDGPRLGSGIRGDGARCTPDPASLCKAIRQTPKDDVADAEAIVEAAMRPTMYHPAGDACIAERALCCGEDGAVA